MAALSAGERECLRLVSKLQSSKQIARTLEISPHTVDQRMRVACRKVGARNRNEAALMLAEYEALNGPLSSNVPIADIPAERPGFPQLAAGESAHETHIVQNGYDSSGPGERAPPEWAARFGAPLPVQGRNRNDLTFGQKMGWAVAVAAASILIFGVLLAALSALGQLV